MLGLLAALALSVFPEGQIDRVEPLLVNEEYLRELVNVPPSAAVDVFEGAEEDHLLCPTENLRQNISGESDLHWLGSSPRALRGHSRVLIDVKQLLNASDFRRGFESHSIALNPAGTLAEIREVEREVDRAIEVWGGEITQAQRDREDVRPIPLMASSGGALREKHRADSYEQGAEGKGDFVFEQPGLVLSAPGLVNVGVGRNRGAGDFWIIAAWTALCCGMAFWAIGRWFDGGRYGLGLLGVSCGLVLLSLFWLGN